MTRYIIYGSSRRWKWKTVQTRRSGSAAAYFMRIEHFNVPNCTQLINWPLLVKKNIWNWILMHFNCNRKSQRFFKYILYDYLMTAQRAKMRKKCNVAFTWLGHCYIPSYFEFGSKGNFCFSRLYQFYIYMLLQQKFVLVILKMKIHVTNSGLKMEK